MISKRIANEMLDHFAVTDEEREEIIRQWQERGFIERTKLELSIEFHNDILSKFDSMSDEAKKGAFKYLFDLMFSAIEGMEEDCEKCKLPANPVNVLGESEGMSDN